MARRITRKQVVALVARWRERLHLGDYALSVRVGRIPAKENARADAAVSPEYREAVLRFDPAGVSPAQLEATVCHELLHCQIEPLAHLALTMAGDDPVKREAVRMAEEELTTRLERVLLAAFAKAE
jgi:hypothetical protein